MGLTREPDLQYLTFRPDVNLRQPNRVVGATPRDDIRISVANLGGRAIERSRRNGAHDAHSRGPLGWSYATQHFETACIESSPT